jgi:hypothetical protein
LFRDPGLTVFGTRWPLFDVGGAIAIAGLAATFAVSAFQNGRALYRLERI